MGGGSNSFFGNPLNLAGMIAAPFTGGASLALTGVNAGIMQPAQKQGRDAAAGMNKLAESQTNAANQLSKDMANQPRVTTADNFLAMKSKALSALKLGLMSTITQPPQASGTKTKLGT